MTSVEVMAALCASRPVRADPDAAIAALFDAIGDIVVLADHDLRITALSRAARRYFGTRARPGAPIDAVAPPSGTGVLGAVARRVSDTGLAETVDLPSVRHPARQLSVTVEPQPDGIVLVIRDVASTGSNALRQD